MAVLETPMDRALTSSIDPGFVAKSWEEETQTTTSRVYLDLNLLDYPSQSHNDTSTVRALIGPLSNSVRLEDFRFLEEGYEEPGGRDAQRAVPSAEGRLLGRDAPGRRRSRAGPDRAQARYRVATRLSYSIRAPSERAS